MSNEFILNSSHCSKESLEILGNEWNSANSNKF